MTMGYKLAIFDLDGTILYTIEDLAFSMNATRVAVGLEPQEVPAIMGMVGNGIRKLIDRSTASDKVNDKELLYKIFMEHYEKHCTEHTYPYEGVFEAVRTIREAGVKTAVLTNKPMVPSKILTDHFFPGMFDMVIGNREGYPLKPDPFCVLEITGKLSTPADRTVIIGDSEVDIRTAQNSGTGILSVTWGFKTEDFLRENGAVKLISNPKDLISSILS